MKNFKIVLIFILVLIVFTSCDSYIKFEKMRFKFIVYTFVISLIIGLIGYAISDKK